MASVCNGSVCSKLFALILSGNVVVITSHALTAACFNLNMRHLWNVSMTLSVIECHSSKECV